MGEYRLGHPGGVVPVVLGGRVGGRPGDLRDRGDDTLDAEPGELPLRGEAGVAALVGRERRPGEPTHPPGDLAPGVAGEPPRHGLAGVRVEGADGGRPQVDVHPERGRILWHGSLPTSLRRGCAYGTSTSLSQPRPAVTSGGSYLFSALGLGHSVCLNGGHRSLIIAIDNRARQIGEDTGLPVLEREDGYLLKMADWINHPVKTEINLPWTSIDKWKKQFN